MQQSIQFWWGLALGFVVAIFSVVAPVSFTLEIVIGLWIVLSGIVARAVWLTWKHQLWSYHIWSFRNTATVAILTLMLALTIPLYQYCKGTTVADLEPLVIIHTTRLKIGGESILHRDYGFGVIARINTSGLVNKRLHLLVAVGEIDADSDDLAREGQTSGELEEEYGRRKPYYRVSFVASPRASYRKVEPGEEYVPFLFLDPRNGMTQGKVRGADASQYVGFRGENPSIPKIITTAPNIYSFIKFIGAAHTGPRLRDEIVSGQLKFALKFESGEEVMIDSKKLHVPRIIQWIDWLEQTPQDVFSRNNIYDRALPSEEDPILKNMK